ncbi:hypothetical protein FA13DRAFT_1786258 [Coprinellus micaceus]|uniref:Uncharacterized protein n=1 Tax=Coprinellus micaceus TaxID=71717 RepID=A0A4Y7TWD3_COPMI|nr:hypothetical protein FA13DRAFT_1786258 [Coprinellus micaceus]
MPPSPNSDIVDVVNEQGELGMLGSLARILDILESAGDMREDVVKLSTIFDVLRNVHFSFMWMQACHLTDQLPEDSVFAIQFTAIAGREMQPLCLAYAIARFKERYSADWGRQGLRLVKVHYEFSATVVFGVMFFDVLLDNAFDEAVKRSLDDDNDFFIFHGDYPVSFWNATAADFAGGLKHPHCETYLTRTRASTKRA